MFTHQDWDNGHWGIQTWIERTAWRTLKNTSSIRLWTDNNPALFRGTAVERAVEQHLQATRGPGRQAAPAHATQA